MILDLRNCVRCGNDHQELNFMRLDLLNPEDGMTHWAICPCTSEPITIRVEADANDDATPRCLLTGQPLLPGMKVWSTKHGFGIIMRDAHDDLVVKLLDDATHVPITRAKWFITNTYADQVFAALALAQSLADIASIYSTLLEESGDVLENSVQDFRSSLNFLGE